MFFTDTWRPRSFYPRIAANRRSGLHTLCLLDIKVREPSLESLARGRKARARPALPYQVVPLLYCGRHCSHMGARCASAVLLAPNLSRKTQLR